MAGPTIGRRLLRERMEERGVKQTHLAAKLGIGQPSVSLWLRGVSRPEPHHREALEYLLDVPAESWLTEEEQETVRRARDDDGFEAPAESDVGATGDGPPSQEEEAG